jgi:hypothetical protein
MRESSLKCRNAVQCVSERHGEVLMSRKCSGTCTEGAAVCRASAEHSTRCVQSTQEHSKVSKAPQSVESTEWVS